MLCIKYSGPCDERKGMYKDEALAKYQITFKSVYLCQDTFLSASVAVGCVLNTVDHVMKGKVCIKMRHWPSTRQPSSQSTSARTHFSQPL